MGIGVFMFVPFGVETMDPWGAEARHFCKVVSSRLIEATVDQRTGSYLYNALGQQSNGITLPASWALYVVAVFWRFPICEGFLSVSQSMC